MALIWQEKYPLRLEMRTEHPPALNLILAIAK